MAVNYVPYDLEKQLTYFAEKYRNSVHESISYAVLEESDFGKIEPTLLQQQPQQSGPCKLPPAALIAGRLNAYPERRCRIAKRIAETREWVATRISVTV